MNTDSLSSAQSEVVGSKPPSRHRRKVVDGGISPARTLGPKASALHRRRLQQASKANASKTKRRIASMDRRFSSGDGSLSFVVKPTPAGLYIERLQRRSLGSRLTQSMVFDDVDWFIRWCEADPMRFDHPVLYQQLRRQGDAYFSAQA